MLAIENHTEQADTPVEPGLQRIETIVPSGAATESEEITPAVFITSLLKDSKGYILIGTQEHGLFVLSPDETGKTHPSFSRISKVPTDISALAIDEQGYIYVGTFLNGLFRLDPGYQNGNPRAWPLGLWSGQLLNQRITALEMISKNRLVISVFKVSAYWRVLRTWWTASSANRREDIPTLEIPPIEPGSPY